MDEVEQSKESTLAVSETAFDEETLQLRIIFQVLEIKYTEE